MFLSISDVMMKVVSFNCSIPIDFLQLQLLLCIRMGFIVICSMIEFNSSMLTDLIICLDDWTRKLISAEEIGVVNWQLK